MRTNPWLVLQYWHTGVTFVMDHYATDRKWKQDSLLDHMKWNQFIAQETHLARDRWRHPQKGCLKMMSPYKRMVDLHTTWQGCLFHLYRLIYLLLQSCNASFSDLMFPRKIGKSVSSVDTFESQSIQCNMMSYTNTHNFHEILPANSLVIIDLVHICTEEEEFSKIGLVPTISPV